MTNRNDALAARLRECAGSDMIPMERAMRLMNEAAEALAAQPAEGEVEMPEPRFWMDSVAVNRFRKTDLAYMAGGYTYVSTCKTRQYDEPYFTAEQMRAAMSATPPAASVDVEGLRMLARKWRKEARELRDYGSKCRDENANAKAYMLELCVEELRPLIDSTGGAKGEHCPKCNFTMSGTGRCVNCEQPAEGDGAVAVAQVRRGGREGPHDALYAGLIPRGPATPEVKEGDLLYLRPAATAQVPDAGPWRWHPSEPYVLASDDFKHDARIRFSGDFADHDDVMSYKDWLLAKLNAAPAAPKGEVVDEAMVERALAAYLRAQDAGESLYGCVTSAMTAALNPEPQS